MKKILKELCIGLFTIVLLNSSNLVNVFAAENSSVSESENLYSNYEQVTQIAIPDENGADCHPKRPSVPCSAVSV